MASALLQSQHLRGSGRGISELETSLVYIVSCRTAKAEQRNPVSNIYIYINKQRERPKGFPVYTCWVLSQFLTVEDQNGNYFFTLPSQTRTLRDRDPY